VNGDKRMIFEKQFRVSKFGCEEYVGKWKDYMLLVHIINEGE